MRNLYVAALATLLILSACGGGGGSPISQNDQPTRGSAYTADPSQNLNSAKRAAVARPAFGSVTQSSNTNIAGVTTDAAKVRFEGNTFFLTIRRQDGSTLAINSRDHLQHVKTGLASPYVDGRSFDEGCLGKVDARGVTIMCGAVEYDEYDYDFLGDWLAGGYWLHVQGNVQAGRVTGVELGAFVDGPEISGPVDLPLRGTATYNGPAGGIGITRTGNDAWLIANGVPVGTYEVVEYTGSFRAVANFSDMTISATISNLRGDAWQKFPDGTSREIYAAAAPGVAYFGPTPINSDGTWSGTDYRFVDPRYTVATAEGSWGGRFSDTADTAGDPRLIVGTHGGHVITTGGTEIIFTGSHHGVTASYQQQ